RCLAVGPAKTLRILTRGVGFKSPPRIGFLSGISTLGSTSAILGSTSRTRSTSTAPKAPPSSRGATWSGCAQHAPGFREQLDGTSSAARLRRVVPVEVVRTAHVKVPTLQVDILPLESRRLRGTKPSHEQEVHVAVERRMWQPPDAHRPRYRSE